MEYKKETQARKTSMYIAYIKKKQLIACVFKHNFRLKATLYNMKVYCKNTSRHERPKVC